MAQNALRLVVNGLPVEKGINTLKLFAALMTQNPGAQTPVKALKTLVKDASAWIANMKAGGDASEVIEVFEGENPVGKSTRGKIARYAEIALDSGNWLPETFGKSEKVTDDSEAEAV